MPRFSWTPDRSTAVAAVPPMTYQYTFMVSSVSRSFSVRVKSRGAMSDAREVAEHRRPALPRARDASLPRRRLPSTAAVRTTDSSSTHTPPLCLAHRYS